MKGGWRPETLRPVQAQYLEDAKRAGRAGITVMGQAAKYGRSRENTREHLQKLGDAGHLVTSVMKERGKGHRQKTYFIPGLEPEEVSITTSNRQAVIYARKASSGEAIVPPDVKVTRCKSFVDTRFTFDPPPGWRGAITEDWLNRRGQA